MTNWLDQSGLNRHADTATGEPGVVPGPGGKEVVRFDGDDYLSTTYEFLPAEYTVISVARYTGPDMFARVISSPDVNWLFGFWNSGDER